jgi:hypothetical protein
MGHFIGKSLASHHLITAPDDVVSRANNINLRKSIANGYTKNNWLFFIISTYSAQKASHP